MRLDTACRLSTYLTLAVASLCVGYAEDFFLPGMVFFGLFMAGVLGAAFALEGRWSLSRRWANVLALVIAAGSVAWIAYHYIHLSEQMTDVVPGPAAMLPYMGPVLMVLLLAKLFRPKQTSDLWLLHLIGLMEAALGCILTGDLTFGILLAAYLVCALWALALFYLQRQAGQTAGQGANVPRVPWRSLGLWPACRWTFTAGAAGLVFFLLTPQHGGTLWDYSLLARSGASPAATGFSGEIDLNRTGTVEVSEAVVMEVVAEDARHEPKLDLDESQRWRGASMDWYEHGRWLPHPFHEAIPRPRPRQTELPDLGDRQYFLNFTVDTRMSRGVMFLADPPALTGREPVRPVICFSDELNSVFTMSPDTRTLFSLPPAFRGRAHYEQVTAPPPEPDVIPNWQYQRSDPRGVLIKYPRNPQWVSTADFLIGKYRLYGKPPVRIQDWTNALLRRLEASGKLTARDLTRDDNGNLLPENWEKVGRVLSDHLASSGEFTYTLDLRRGDPWLDPTEDFLYNVKQGHCERFATALALMLRSCGNPTRMVIGFRGAESQGNGLYLVRESHAHSWVESLIQRTGPDGTARLYWLTLDPTPAGDPRGSGFSLARSWQDFRTAVRMLWRDFILEYNTDQQAEAASALVKGLTGGLLRKQSWANSLAPPRGIGWTGFAALCVGAIGLALIARFLRSRRKAERDEPAVLPEGAFYARLLAVLARRLRLLPRRSDTPQEFAAAAGQALQAHPAAAPLAGVPRQVVRLYYRVRYGGRPLEAPEQEEIDRRLAEVETALEPRPPEPT